MNSLGGMERRKFLKVLGGAGCALGLGGFPGAAFGAAKEPYPARKITFIIGFPPGGGSDLGARAIAQFSKKYLQEISSKPDKVGVVIKNDPRGSGMKAFNDIYHAKPDGYTIAQGDDVLHTRSILGDLGFDPFQLTFIARIVSGTKVLVTGKRSNIFTWNDVVKESKKSPVRIGCANFGTSNHVGIILLIDTTKLPAKEIFFGGTANVNAALIRGDIPLALNNEDTVRELINAKELRPILSFSEKSSFPDVQSVKDIGFPELVEPIKLQRYIIAPPHLPADIKKTMVEALKKTMADKEFLAWSANVGLGFDPVFGSELDSLVRRVQGFYQSKENILRTYLKA